MRAKRRLLTFGRSYVVFEKEEDNRPTLRSSTCCNHKKTKKMKPLTHPSNQPKVGPQAVGRYDASEVYFIFFLVFFWLPTVTTFRGYRGILLALFRGLNFSLADARNQEEENVSCASQRPPSAREKTTREPKECRNEVTVGRWDEDEDFVPGSP